MIDAKDFKIFTEQIAKKCLCKIKWTEFCDGILNYISSPTSYLRSNNHHIAHFDELFLGIIQLLCEVVKYSFNGTNFRICKQIYYLFKSISEATPEYFFSQTENKSKHASYAARKIMSTVIVFGPNNMMLVEVCAKISRTLSNYKLLYFEILKDSLCLPYKQEPPKVSENEPSECAIIIQKYNTNKQNEITEIILENFLKWIQNIEILSNETSFIRLWGKLLSLHTSYNEENLRMLTCEPHIEFILKSTCQQSKKYHCLAVFEVILSFLVIRLPNFVTFQETMANVLLVNVEKGFLFKLKINRGISGFGGNSISIESAHSSNCIKNFDEKYTRLISLSVIASFSVMSRLEKITQSNLQTVTECLIEWLQSGFNFTNGSNASDWLVTLYIDQDDQLVEALVSCVEIYNHLKYSKNLDQFSNYFCPHNLMISFLFNTGMDHDVIMDFLSSNETNTLLYLVHYLKIVILEWERFVLVHELLHKKESSISLDSTMSILIRLRLSIDRLNRHNLFPYCVTPLIKLLENCESKYENNL